MKKIFILIITICILFTATSAYASSIYSEEQVVHGYLKQYQYEGEYSSKLYEDKATSPFLNIFSSNGTYDTKIVPFGITLGTKTINVKSEMLGVQIMFAEDILTVDGSLNSCILSSTNVVIINGEINQTCLIVAPAVYLNEGASINADAFIITESLSINGDIQGSVIGKIDKIQGAGSINGDLRIATYTPTIAKDNIKGEIYFETSGNVEEIKNSYPNATIVNLNSTQAQTNSILDTVKKGLIHVLLSVFVCFLITRKPSKFTEKITAVLTKRTIFVVLMGVVGLIGAIVIIFLFITCLFTNLTGLAFVLLLAYLTYIVSVSCLSLTITGIALYLVIASYIFKDKEKELLKKLALMLGIFTLLFVLVNIPVVSGYFGTAMLIISAGIVLALPFKIKQK